jgi:cell division transport system permease protein
MSGDDKRIISQRTAGFFYSIIGVALVLFLLGLFGLMMIQGQKIVEQLKERVNLIVEFKPETKPAQIDLVMKKLQSGDFVKPGSITFTSKEQAAELLREDFGDDFIKLGLNNPLYDVLTFNTKSEFMHSDSLEKIRTGLMNVPVVSDVFYQEGLVDNIESNIKKIGYLSLAIGVLFIIVAITLIHNTIRLALYSNRFLIKNMELIGASWGFISRPYLVRSVKNGFWSAMISIILLIAVLALVQIDQAILSEFEYTLELTLLFGGLILLGILISGLSTFYVVNKYLKMRLDDLY